MDALFVALNPIPQSKSFRAPSEARAWRSEDTRRHGCKVNLPSWQAVPMVTGDCSLGNDVACLLRGTGPLSSLRKDRASLGAEIPTAACG